MIGVAADPDQLPWVTEFFELFKTPWEPMLPDKRYAVVVITDGRTEPQNASVAVIYGMTHPVDLQVEMVGRAGNGRGLGWQKAFFPIFGGVRCFDGPHVDGTLDGGASYTSRHRATTIRRFGYDLLHEVSVLLTTGQPPEYAGAPTMELHIDILRQALRDEQVAFAEVPPRPAGYDFVCCLTHDVDFFGIRRHRADRTLAGFVVRGTLGTTVDLLRGRRSVGEGVANLMAVAMLPLVFSGVARDFWHPFDDYASADRGHAATYFLVPVKGQSGVSPGGIVEPRRAVAYEASEIADEVRDASRTNIEFAVHGIDAWRDADAGINERNSLWEATGAEAAGVRMHWLYYDDEQSPRNLEVAGFTYDSSWGYNETVGFRAGTLQAFKVPGTKNLFELPLAVMDTAMLYSGRMALSPSEANRRSHEIVNVAHQFGGALVINWHDRSLAPERQWGRCYDHLLDDIERHRVWFATSSAAVDWFRWRRSIRFETAAEGSEIRVTALAPPAGVPPARLVMQRPGDVSETVYAGGTCAVQCDAAGTRRRRVPL